MEVLLPIVSLVMYVLLFAIVISAIVFLFKRARGAEISVDFTLLFGIYLYIVSFISIVILGLGIMYATKGFLARRYGLDFSYRKQQVSSEMVYDAEINDYREENVIYEFERDIEEKELIKGITLIFVSIPIFLSHSYGAKGLENKDVTVSIVRRIYLLFGLVLFAIISIIALPAGIYETLQYWLTEQPEDLWGKVVPGEGLSVAIAFIPMWIYYLISYINFTDKFSEN